MSPRIIKKEQNRKRLRKKKLKLSTIVGCVLVPKGNTKKRVLTWPVPVKSIIDMRWFGV